MEDILKQLEEEARLLASTNIPPTTSANTEQPNNQLYEFLQSLESEAINLANSNPPISEEINEEIEEENLVEVYNSNGEVILIPDWEREDEYTHCKDGTWCREEDNLYFNGYYYNRHTTNVSRDDEGEYYLENDSNTYYKLVIFDESKTVDYSKYRIISRDTELTYRLFYGNSNTNNDILAITVEDLGKYNYEIKDNKLIKTRSAEEVKSEFFIKYPYFELTIRSIYGDNWDFEYVSATSTYGIIIKFDEFIITNSRRQSHKITDLYVVLPINTANYSFSNNLYGGRGKMTINERNNSYAHSHLSSSYDVMSTFCLGTGPINNYLLDLNKNPNENSLFSVLYNIKIYVEWESIEGTPYKYINEIGKSEIAETTREPYTIDNIQFLREYINKFTFPIKTEVINNKSFIKLDETIIEKQLLEIVQTGKWFLSYFNTDNRSKLEVFKNKTNGKYYIKSVNGGGVGKSNRPLLKYKGIDIYTEVYSQETIIIENNDRVIHPQYTKKFIEFASRRITQYYFQKNSSTDTRKSQYYCI